MTGPNRLASRYQAHTSVVIDGLKLLGLRMEGA